MSVGNEVEVVIKNIRSGDAPPPLSRFDAVGRKVWNDIEEAYKNEAPVVGKIVDKTKGGLRVDINGIEAFMPGSQIDSRPIRSLDTYIGQDIEAKIIKFSRSETTSSSRERSSPTMVVNEQKAEDAWKDRHRLHRRRHGQESHRVRCIRRYRRNRRIAACHGYVVGPNPESGRSFKSRRSRSGKGPQARSRKGKDLARIQTASAGSLVDGVEVYPVDSRVKGRVSSVTEYGVFVELEPGVEGLVHVSEISWSKRGREPETHVQSR